MSESFVPLVCANHPLVETNLRCNRCNKPICPKCALRTPTGYRCKECVQGQQKVFVTARWIDYVSGGITAGVLSLLASLLVVLVSSITGWFAWMVVAMGASSVAVGMAEVVRFATRRHRARSLFITIVVALFAGALPVAAFLLMTRNVWALLFLGVYLAIAVPIIYSRLSGMRLTRK